MPAQQEQSRVRLYVGLLFTAITHTKRVIPLAKVLDYEAWREGARYKCVWYDENGKHHEWFNLDDRGIEFRKFQFM